MRNLRRVSILFVAVVMIALLLGCERKVTVVMDELWAYGQFRLILCDHHYAPNPGSSRLGYSEESDHLASLDWTMKSYPLPGGSGHAVTKSKFAKMDASYEDGFLSIAGSELVIHLTGLTEGNQFALFDPQTSQPVSKIFPAAAAPLIFNRYRTLCLTLSDGQAVVMEVLSAAAGEPKISSRPDWTSVLMRARNSAGKTRFVLSADAQYLMLLPSFPSPSEVNAANFKVEAYSSKGKKEIWSVPISRNWETFDDAEFVDGQILCLSILNNAGLPDVRLNNLKGELVYSKRMQPQAHPLTFLWDPPRQAILCKPSIFSLFEPYAAFQIWNYKSNTVVEVPLSL